MPNQSVIPEPLYIPDRKERLLDMLAEELVKMLISEVDAEEEIKANKAKNNFQP
jgi:hypothetical protein